MRQRILDINPDCQVTANRMFFMPDNAEQVDFTQYAYVVDAIDTVSAKIELIVRCTQQNIPIISAMGAGNKLDPTQFTLTDIYQTSGCPLARVMRRELRRRNIPALKVVFSPEPPLLPALCADAHKRTVPGSTAFVPSVAGLILASAVVRDLTDMNEKRI